MNKKLFPLFLALALMLLAAGPSYADGSFKLIVQTITDIVKSWNHGRTEGKTEGRTTDTVIKETGGSGGTRAPSKEKVARDTAMSTYEHARNSLLGPDKSKAAGEREELAEERERALDAARKRGEQEVLEGPIGH